MKILFIIPSLETGGAELQTINQITHLFNNYPNIAVELAVLSGKVGLEEKLTIAKNRIHVNHNNATATVIDSSMVYEIPIIVNFIRKTISKSSPTHILAILPFAHLCARMAILFTLQKRPKIFTYYRSVYFDISPIDSVLKKIIWGINSLLARLDTGTFFISNAVLRNINKYQYVKNPLVLPNSLPAKPQDALLGRDLLKKMNYFPEYLILIPGRLYSKKGHAFFFNAFCKFLKINNINYPTIGVVVAGEGFEKENLLELQYSLGLSKEVLFLGNVENQILLSLYKNAHLVVIPSLFEGFGNVAIEGLMQEATMLVSDAGGLKEIIRNGENGFLFQRGSENDFLNMLQLIYGNEIHLKMSKEALHEEFLTKYNIDQQISKILSHLKS